jgi:hypothetical protein
MPHTRAKTQAQIEEERYYNQHYNLSPTAY